MKLFAALWSVSGFREPGEIARWFYEDGTLVQVFEDRVAVKQCKVSVLNDIVTAHLYSGWSQLLPKEYELAPEAQATPSHLGDRR